MDPYQILQGLPPPQPIVIAPDPPVNQQATLDPQGTIVHPGEDHDELEGRDDSMHHTSADVFSLYENKELLPGSQPHPGDIVEAAPLAALALPLPTYPLADSIPAQLVHDCKLSSLQLEGVLYAVSSSCVLCRLGIFHKSYCHCQLSAAFGPFQSASHPAKHPFIYSFIHPSLPPSVHLIIDLAYLSIG